LKAQEVLFAAKWHERSRIQTGFSVPVCEGSANGRVRQMRMTGLGKLRRSEVQPGEGSVWAERVGHIVVVARGTKRPFSARSKSGAMRRVFASGVRQFQACPRLGTDGLEPVFAASPERLQVGNTLSRKITTSAAAGTFSGRVALRSTLVPGGIAPDNRLWSDESSRSAVDWLGNCQILSEFSQLLIAVPSKGLAWICSSCSLHLRHGLCKLLFHVDLWIY